MTEIALRELRNNTSEVLRRVEDGEEVDVTVNGRVGRPARPTAPAPTVPAGRGPAREPGRRGLRDDLRDLLGDETTDHLKDPWERYEA